MVKIFILAAFLLVSVSSVAGESCSGKEKESMTKTKEESESKKEAQASEEYKYHLDYIKRIDRSAASR